jgi:hypothetical protein
LIEAKRHAARLEISSESLALLFDTWRGEIEDPRTADDFRALQNLLRQFLMMIGLGKGIAKLWYTYPINALAELHQLKQNRLFGTAEHI